MIGCVLLVMGLLILLYQLAEMKTKLIQQQEIIIQQKIIMGQAKRARWICRPESCVEIHTDWDAIMERTQLDRDSAQ